MKQNDFSVALGENLKKLRKLRNLSVAQLAEILGICQDDVRKYERGQRALTVEKLIAFSVALGCSPQNVLDGLDPRIGATGTSGEIKMMTQLEHDIMMHMATDWDGDRKALIIADGIYMAIPPKRRREIIMALALQAEQAIANGEIEKCSLPDGMEYMLQALGGLYAI